MTWVLDSTRIKQTFLRPTSDNGTSVPRWHTGFRRFCVTAVWGFLFLGATVVEAAFTPAPKASVKALKITRGKPIADGVVFVDGKYIAPPYVVERYGNVIRINQVQVTQPVIDWAEFLKTQPTATITKTEVAPPPVVETAPVAKPESAPVAVPEPAASVDLSADDSDEDLLDELFEDAPAKPVKPVAKAPKPKPVVAAKPVESKPVVQTVVRMEGEFEMNDSARGMVAKVNAARREIDVLLRRGGFVCFGSAYSRVSGDKRLAMQIMEKVPEVMKRNSELEPFAAGIRQAGFVYFTPKLVRDLFAHRLDYLTLQKRWKKMKDKAELDAIVDRAGSKAF